MPGSCVPPLIRYESVSCCLIPLEKTAEKGPPVLSPEADLESNLTWNFHVLGKKKKVLSGIFFNTLLYFFSVEEHFKSEVVTLAKCRG